MFAVTLAAIGLACGPLSFAKVISTDGFEDGSTRPISVVVLPSEVQLMKQKLVRVEAQVEESGELEAHLTAAVAEQFRLHSYEVKVIDAAAIAADPMLQELVVDSNRRFRQRSSQYRASG
jgi:hypothetical protein